MKLVVVVAPVTVVVTKFVVGTTTQEHTFEIRERGKANKSKVSSGRCRRYKLAWEYHVPQRHVL
jgi:hypothetical protein